MVNTQTAKEENSEPAAQERETTVGAIHEAVTEVVEGAHAEFLADMEERFQRGLKMGSRLSEELKIKRYLNTNQELDKILEQRITTYLRDGDITRFSLLLENYYRFAPEYIDLRRHYENYEQMIITALNAEPSDIESPIQAEGNTDINLVMFQASELGLKLDPFSPGIKRALKSLYDRTATNKKERFRRVVRDMGFAFFEELGQ